jgi:hypothetical protein
MKARVSTRTTYAGFRNQKGGGKLGSLFHRGNQFPQRRRGLMGGGFGSLLFGLGKSVLKAAPRALAKAARSQAGKAVKRAAVAQMTSTAEKLLDKATGSGEQPRPKPKPKPKPKQKQKPKATKKKKTSGGVAKKK